MTQARTQGGVRGVSLTPPARDFPVFSMFFATFWVLTPLKKILDPPSLTRIESFRPSPEKCLRTGLAKNHFVCEFPFFLMLTILALGSRVVQCLVPNCITHVISLFSTCFCVLKEYVLSQHCSIRILLSLRVYFHRYWFLSSLNHDVTAQHTSVFSVVESWINA